MNLKTILWILPALAILGSSVNGWSKDIYTDQYSSGFNYKWVSTHSGDQNVQELLPFDSQRDRAVGAVNIIHWHWNKKENEKKWSGWGMQWRGWNTGINLYPILGFQDTPNYRTLTREIFDQFRKNATRVRLKFRVFISGFEEKKAKDHSMVQVRFDGEGDKSSREIAFLSDKYLFNEDSIATKPDTNKKNLGLDQNVPYRVEIPLDHFEIIRNNIDPSKIKQIVFSTPNQGKTKGDLLLFDIKIE